jgi:hypothetical protein
VCQRDGVQARSKNDLRSLIDRVDLRQVSLYAILETANRVEWRTQPFKRAYWLTADRQFPWGGRAMANPT